jgi:hypothetical protein
VRRLLVVAAGVAVAVGGCSHESSAPPIPSFRNDIAPVLEKHCTGKECHGDDPAPDVTMDLRTEAAYAQLVNVPAEMGETRRMRVVPYDVEDSFLVHKLAGPTGHREGKKMPLDPETGESLKPSPLPARFEDVIAKWIEAGAPDN